MSDIPIIFSGPMVRALLDGRKTMTRRPAWREKWEDGGLTSDTLGGGPRERLTSLVRKPSPWQKVKPGDRLWVRESYRHLFDLDELDRPVGGGKLYYRADNDQIMEYDADAEETTPVRWRPSIHMPRWASRLTLTVTATKIERLQDIGWKDAIAEGLLRGAPLLEVPNSHGTIYHDGVTDPIDGWTRDPTAAFRTLWEAIHGRESWDANPEVVALTFTVAKQNIDAREESKP